jgi:hypothetical protein
MSDPVSNHDIEDVLTSIRRLVAQGNVDIQQEARKEPPVLRNVESEVPSDRLVLTSAFRVEDPEPDSQQSGVLQTPPRFTPVAEPVETDEDEAPTPEMFWTEEVKPTATPLPEVSDRASLEATIAELEAAVTQAPDEWEPDGSEEVFETSVTSAFLHKLDARNAKTPEETVSDAVAEHIAETISEEIAESIPFEDTTFDKVEVTEEAVNQNQDTAPVVEDAVAEVVEAVTKDEPTFSHARFDEVYDPIAEATADAAETESGDVYGDELADDAEPAFGGVANPAEGQLADPDALRALVGEMIREELQGEMGERITRNVRKLVRREINRVLIEQEV